MGRVRTITIIVLSVLAMSGLVKSIVRNVHNTGRISFLRQQIEVQVTKNEELQKQVMHRYSTEYLEREARDRLGMVKENEVVVLLPSIGGGDNVLGVGLSSGKAEGSGEQKLLVNVPIWQQWRFIFFGR